MIINNIEINYKYDSAMCNYYVTFEPTLKDLSDLFIVWVFDDGEIYFAYRNKNDEIENIVTKSMTDLIVRLIALLNNKYDTFLDEFIKCVEYEFEDYINIRNRFQKAKNGIFNK